MVDASENLVVNILRNIQELLCNIEGELKFHGQRLSALEGHLATLITTLPAMKSSK